MLSKDLLFVIFFHWWMQKGSGYHIQRWIGNIVLHVCKIFTIKYFGPCWEPTVGMAQPIRCHACKRSGICNFLSLVDAEGQWVSYSEVDWQYFASCLQNIHHQVLWSLLGAGMAQPIRCHACKISGICNFLSLVDAE